MATGKDYLAYSIYLEISLSHWLCLWIFNNLKSYSQENMDIVNLTVLFLISPSMYCDWTVPDTEVQEVEAERSNRNQTPE